MKRMITCFPVALFLLWGCNTNIGSDNPKEVLIHFFQSLSEKNIQETKKWVTEDSEGMISLMQMSIKNMGAAEESDQFNPEKISIGEPEIRGEEAQVPVTEKSTGESVRFFLKKESGKWKVAFDMATLARMAKQKMEKDGEHSGDIDSLFGSLQNNSDSFNQHLNSAARVLDGLSEEQLHKAKEFLEKNPELIKENMEKVKEELKKYENNNP